LLNVVEGGKKKRTAIPRRHVEIASVLEALPEAILLLDDAGRIANINIAAEKLIGQPRKQLLGHLAGSLLRERLKGGDDFDSLLGRALHAEPVRFGQMVFHCPDGNALQVIMSASPVCDDAGHVTGVLLAMRDITELAALQKHSDNNERQVAVGQMTAGLVHDFSNVLNTIIEALAVLENNQQRSERERTILGIIANAVHNGSQIIRNTREYLIGNRQKPMLIDVRTLLDEVLELTHPALQTHIGVTVVRETQNCGHVRGSVDELRRAFTNLVLNALEAMLKGGTLTVACTRTNHHIIVNVSDTGVGIPLEAQKKVFSSYFTTKATGTGLGLAGAKRAIQAHGGDIRFESVPAGGTTFSVSLPAAEEASADNSHAA
jgi:PAS domain S-box-containing protein